jgi:predicted AAA+ superfamily ATPase
VLGGLRAVVVNGPRQSGKSTLLAQVQAGRGPIVNLDHPSALDAAQSDPVAFLDQLPDRSAIDEFQRAGDPLLLALKMRLDTSRQPGQFLLAGSTRFLTTRRLSETLTGRVGIVEVLPLSMGERHGTTEGFIDAVFQGTSPADLPASKLRRADYAELIALGGFPELVLGPATPRLRRTWCQSYLNTVTALANVEQVAEVRRPELVDGLLRQVAARSSTEVVVNDYARELAVNEATVRNYFDLLDTLYLTRRVSAWTTSRTNRAKRRNVAHIVDTALACHLLGVTTDQLADLGSRWFGPLLESFVIGEVAKQLGWASHPTGLHHFRDREGREVDIVLERGQAIVGIEVKATSTPTLAHAKHLAYLRDRVGERFLHGIVAHTGSLQMQLSDRITAMPISTLWG